ncbi:hypothetical protein SAMN05192552_103221 [Natrinema hispanicum]|uniref:Uncharacterized protein n=1 Tax=Natrinema hispanicum TaxID=392421 RepID=A0A1I0IF90_9EURY|nr:hypothetical protein SAMN05192552_103221 [Natrinema hispanicum]SET95584.1 hypothetical protein SAMN04488694_12014 [Natrinema hispanicum]
MDVTVMVIIILNHFGIILIVFHHRIQMGVD